MKEPPLINKWCLINKQKDEQIKATTTTNWPTVVCGVCLLCDGNGYERSNIAPNSSASACGNGERKAKKKTNALVRL